MTFTLIVRNFMVSPVLAILPVEMPTNRKREVEQQKSLNMLVNSICRMQRNGRLCAASMTRNAVPLRVVLNDLTELYL